VVRTPARELKLSTQSRTNRRIVSLGCKLFEMSCVRWSQNSKIKMTFAFIRSLKFENWELSHYRSPVTNLDSRLGFMATKNSETTSTR
jgi:hypothetical protein